MNVRSAVLSALSALIALAEPVRAAPPTPGPTGVARERSFWLHASLASAAQRGYWGPEFPACRPPTDGEIRNAVGVLCDACAANRLYLVYHREMPLADAERTFELWRKHSPTGVQIVPALLLRMYDKGRSEVFAPDEIRRLAAFFRRAVSPDLLAVFDVYAGRDQGGGLEHLSKEYPGGLIRLGIQPGERIAPPFVHAVQDTWSGLCHGRTDDDWRAPGFGAETLRRWVQDRNRGGGRVAWNLVAVAWDYSATERGGYPGYDDADRNMPLPAGRNGAAMNEILRIAQAERLGGFSSDLLILQANSQSAKHDGRSGSLYETLKRGGLYGGHYAQPFQEIATIYRTLRDGEGPAGSKP